MGIKAPYPASPYPPKGPYDFKSLRSCFHAARGLGAPEVEFGAGAQDF